MDYMFIVFIVTGFFSWWHNFLRESKDASVKEEKKARTENEAPSEILRYFLLVLYHYTYAISESFLLRSTYTLRNHVLMITKYQQNLGNLLAVGF